MMTDQKPPVGLTPKHVYEDRKGRERCSEIFDAMERYAVANKPIPPPWFKELRELLGKAEPRPEPVARPERDGFGCYILTCDVIAADINLRSGDTVRLNMAKIHELKQEGFYVLFYPLNSPNLGEVCITKKLR